MLATMITEGGVRYLGQRCLITRKALLALLVTESGVRYLRKRCLIFREVMLPTFFQ